MHKTKYLNQTVVNEFIDWFIEQGIHSYPHQYNTKRVRIGHEQCVKFENLISAHENYYWPFNSFEDYRRTLHKSTSGNFEESNMILTLLSKDLRDSIFENNTNKFELSAIALMKWGGTHRTRISKGVEVGNIPWLKNINSINHVRSTLDFLKSENDNENAYANLINFRFNSGFTKLYSLLIDDFVIYDSRVAAALAWFALRFTQQNSNQCLQDSLKFACMRDSNHCRNPQGIFPYINNNPGRHAVWNLRANWILSTVAKKINPSLFSHSNNTIRNLESALFMWGYEV